MKSEQEGDGQVAEELHLVRRGRPASEQESYRSCCDISCLNEMVRWKKGEKIVRTIDNGQ